MALWTPYEQETALDLSRPTLKREPDSPTLPSFHSPPHSEYAYPQYAVTPNLPVNAYHPYYAQYINQEYKVPSLQSSPEFVGAAQWSPPQYVQKPVKVAALPLVSPEYDKESLDDDMEYQTFERDALRAMAEKNGGTLLGNNPRMRRVVQSNQTADDSYRKQRERNNFAAKQSRDRRKLREVRLAFQVTYLKKKMADLRAKLATGVCDRCH